MGARRKSTEAYYLRIDKLDPANRQILETFAACPWGTLNQTILEALRIGVAAMGCKPSSNVSRSATGKPKATAASPDPSVPASQAAAPSVPQNIERSNSPGQEEAQQAPQTTQEPKLNANTEGLVSRHEPGPTKETSDAGNKQPQHRRVVGVDPTRARARALDMVKQLTGKP